MRAFAALLSSFLTVAFPGHAWAEDPWGTHCFGRFLVNVPADATVKAGYRFAGDEVTTIGGVDATRFRAMVDARERELSGAKRSDGGSMLLQRVGLDADAEVLSSWKTPSSRLTHLQDLYVHVPEQRVAYHVRGESLASSQAQALTYLRSLRSSFRYRESTGRPTEAGFCIERGLIARSKLNEEEVSVGMRPRSLPGVSLTLTTYVTAKPDKPLLDRMSSLPAEYRRIEAAMRNLRRGERQVGVLKGQQILGRADDGGKRAYAFLWESQGVPKSLAQPFVSLEMVVDPTNADGAPAFRTDEEALRFWDEVLDSLRLRPGAL